MISIPYRGKSYRVNFIPQEWKEVSISLKNMVFEITIPTKLNDFEISYAIKKALQKWMIEKANSFVAELLERLCSKTNVYTYTFTMEEFESGWGEHGYHALLKFDWRLIFEKNEYLEAVILLELLCIKHQESSRRFKDDRYRGSSRAIKELKENHPEHYQNYEWLHQNEETIKTHMEQITQLVEREMLPYKPILENRFVIRDATNGEFQSKDGPVDDITQAEWFLVLEDSIQAAELNPKMMNIVELRISTGRIVREIKK